MSADQTPYETVLGARFHHLQPQLRQLHGARALNWSGQATVTIARSLLGRLIARLAGFPPRMDKAPLHLAIRVHADGSQEWERRFDGHRTVSGLALGSVGEAPCLVESFGPFRMECEARVKADALGIQVLSCSAFGIALPAALRPKSRTTIWQDEAGRYRFDVGAELPWVGPIIRYEGWLRPAEASGFVGRA